MYCEVEAIATTPTRSFSSSQPKPPAPITRTLHDSWMKFRICNMSTTQISNKKLVLHSVDKVLQDWTVLFAVITLTDLLPAGHARG